MRAQTPLQTTIFGPLHGSVWSQLGSPSPPKSMKNRCLGGLPAYFHFLLIHRCLSSTAASFCDNQYLFPVHAAAFHGLSDFYAKGLLGQWKFTEKVDYLRVIKGAAGPRRHVTYRRIAVSPSGAKELRQCLGQVGRQNRAKID